TVCGSILRLGKLASYEGQDLGVQVNRHGSLRGYVKGRANEMHTYSQDAFNFRDVNIAVIHITPAQYYVARVRWCCPTYPMTITSCSRSKWKAIRIVCRGSCAVPLPMCSWSWMTLPIQVVSYWAEY